MSGTGFWANRAVSGTGGLWTPFLAAVGQALLWTALPNGKRATFYDLWSGHTSRPRRFRKHLEEDLGQVFALLASGAVTANVAARFPLTEVVQALELAESRTLNGKVVEFAIRLPGGKLLPVDSKWTSSHALEQLSAPDVDPARRQQLAAQVEKEVEKRVREVSQYIDPATTSPFALAAVPDAVSGRGTARGNTSETAEPCSGSLSIASRPP